jgi:hypothetical protein
MLLAMQLEFDALAALRTEGLQPPNPRVRPLDNLNKCRRILPSVSFSPNTLSYKAISSKSSDVVHRERGFL